MLIKGIVDEDFINYKLPSMYIATATCSFKCDHEYGSSICQNSELAKHVDISIPATQIVDRYLNNPITHAIVLGGLEPFDRFDDVLDLIDCLRIYPAYRWDRHYIPEPRDHPKANDPFVIYTGYNRNEIKDKINLLIDYDYNNIIVKFGRYIPNQKPHFDPVLGVYLASDNQYAERIS